MKPKSQPSSESKASSGNVSNIGAVAKYFKRDVKPTFFVEAQLVILTFCTGMQDATTFPDYHCFASNQTGNTIFLCLALVLPQLNGDMFILSNIGIALGLFLGAGWITGQLSHLIGPRRRWWLVLSNLIQTGMVFGAAGFQYRHGIDLQGPRALPVIGLLAMAAGSQVVQSRSMAMPEISTAMATAAWIDLLMDQKLFVLDNRPRNRRIAFLASLIAGTVTGAFVYRETSSATALAVSGVGKLLVTAMYLLAEADKEPKEQLPV